MINENTHVSAFKYEKYTFDQPFLSFKAKSIFIGKSRDCQTTEFSGALNKSNFDGNTILFECEDSKYVYISGPESFEFRTHDKVLHFISLMGNIMIPYTFAVGEKYKYFISTHYKFIGDDKIQEGNLLNSSNDSLVPYDYHLSKNGKDCFKKFLEGNLTPSNWLSMECGDMEETIKEDIEEDVQEDGNIQELQYTDGSK